MAAYQDTHFARVFRFENSAGVATDISTWLFEAQLRVDLGDPTPQLTLTNENAGFYIVDGPAGRLELRLTAEQTLALPLGKIIFDVLRTDAAPGPTWLFAAKFVVRQPVTR